VIIQALTLLAISNITVMSLKYEAINASSSAVPSDTTKPFTISTPPKTDIWRTITRGNMEFNAPGIGARIPVSSFTSLSATVSGPWKTQFDQGGILIAFPKAPGADLHDSQWIKAGIEYFNGEPKLGVVGTDRFSDWSLCPMFEAGGKAQFVAEKEADTIWIYAVVKGKKEPLREVKWADLEGRAKDAEMWVGVYGAKPTPEEGDGEAGIEVTFEGFKIETSG
jgi:regulation of enolase protein 1 (concanavalin A-like superfamily)